MVPSLAATSRVSYHGKGRPFWKGAESGESSSCKSKQVEKPSPGEGKGMYSPTIRGALRRVEKRVRK
jgi:hypothetical protein